MRNVRYRTDPVSRLPDHVLGFLAPYPLRQAPVVPARQRYPPVPGRFSVANPFSRNCSNPKGEYRIPPFACYHIENSPLVQGVFVW